MTDLKVVKARRSECRLPNTQAFTYGELHILQTIDKILDEETRQREFGSTTMPLGFYKHTSMSCRDRYPTWEEIKQVKKLLHGDVFCFQLQPPSSHYVNLHPNTFHLWEVL